MAQEFVLRQKTPLKPFNKHWQFCVGSGHAPLALRADYTEQLEQVQRELGIERVRFHGIFGDDMQTYVPFSAVMPVPGIEAYELNFRQCGKAYDNVLAAGMKPFVELSFMPEALSRDPNGKSGFFYHPNTCPPKDEKKWVEYITAFINFLIHRYGKAEVESWHFEVWNEPDLQGFFFNGTKAEYFHLYEITARAIKAVDPAIQVGGPATSGCKWVPSFVHFCKENNVPLDFVSTHCYAGDPLGGVKDDPDITKDEMVSVADGFAEAAPAADTGTAAGAGGSAGDDIPPFLRDMMEKMKNGLSSALKENPKDTILPYLRCVMGDPIETEGKTPDNVFRTNAPLVKEQAEGLPVFITEWNCCATFSAFTNDTRKVAAYDVKTALAVEDSVTGSSIWCFSDIFEEFHQFAEEFHGGFGLMTPSGIKKPVYHAFQLLNQAGNRRYDLPGALDQEVSAAAFEDDDGTETMLVFTRQKMQNLFDLPKEAVNVTVELPAAPNAVTLYRIDEDHCNPLKVWEEMGKPRIPNKAEVMTISAKSAMEPETPEHTYADGKLTMSLALGVNDVYFVKIEK